MDERNQRIVDSVVQKARTLAHHGIEGQRWGIQNGPPYPLDANQISNTAKQKEPKITKDVVSSALKAGSRMHGLEHRLKTKESIERKMETDTTDIKDAVRYTTITSDKKFVSSYFKMKQNLEDKGYKEIRCKNNFELYKKGQVKHKSVQSIFQDEDGYKFEIQFQTPSSQKAKDKKVPIYEERRKPGISKERQIELENQMVELAEKVTEPKDIQKIKTH